MALTAGRELCASAKAADHFEALGCDASEAKACATLAWRLDAAVDASRVVRYLRNRKGNINAAEAALRASLRWRETYLPVVATPEVRKELEKFKFVVQEGRSAAGELVVVVRANRLGKHTYDDIAICERAAVFFAEALETRFLGPLEKIAVIFSRLDLIKRRVDLDWIKMLGRTLEANYPERIRVCYVAPVSPAISGIWNGVLKWCFSPSSRSKIQLRQSAKSFLELVPAENLTVDLGGMKDETPSMSLILDDGRVSSYTSPAADDDSESDVSNASS